MPLRKADLTSTRKFEDENGQDWLVLRVGGLTKGEADRLNDLTGAMMIDPQSFGQPDASAAKIEIERRTAEANRALFELLCSEWSLEDEPNGAAYDALELESGQWVDECISDVLRERRERAEKKGRSGKRPSRRASSSAKAAS
jgi:hypothetical protein